MPKKSETSLQCHTGSETNTKQTVDIVETEDGDNGVTTTGGQTRYTPL